MAEKPEDDGSGEIKVMLRPDWRWPLRRLAADLELSDGSMAACVRHLVGGELLRRKLITQDQTGD